MIPIKNIEKITELYSDWKPTQAAFVKSIEWSPGQLIICFYYRVGNASVGWTDSLQELYELTFLFRNLSEVHINLGSNQFIQITGFDIFDIADRGLEKLNYQVADYEAGKLDFCCEEIEVVHVTEPEMIML